MLGTSKQRWRWLLAAVPLAALLALSITVMTRGGGRITRANLDKIQTGMTRDEVDTLLGAPRRALRFYPGIRAHEEYQIYTEYQEGGPNEPGVRKPGIQVWFDPEGKVVVKAIDEPAEPHPLELIRAWLGKIRTRLGL